MRSLFSRVYVAFTLSVGSELARTCSMMPPTLRMSAAATRALALRSMAWATASRRLIVRATGRTASGDVAVAALKPASTLMSGVVDRSWPVADAATISPSIRGSRGVARRTRCGFREALTCSDSCGVVRVKRRRSAIARGPALRLPKWTANGGKPRPGPREAGQPRERTLRA